MQHSLAAFIATSIQLPTNKQKTMLDKNIYYIDQMQKQTTTALIVGRAMDGHEDDKRQAVCSSLASHTYDGPNTIGANY
jgi:hypothetical protein